MVDASRIAQHMAVIGSDGVPVGTVDHVAGDRIRLTRHEGDDGKHSFVPLSWVTSVGAAVVLDRPAGGDTDGGAAGARDAAHDLGDDAARNGGDRLDTISEAAIDDGSAALGAGTAALGGAGAAASGFAQDHAGDRDDTADALPGWLKWVLVAIGVVLLVLLVRSCLTAPLLAPAANTTAGVAASDRDAADGSPAAESGPNAAAAAFLASGAPPPRSFVVDGIAFRSGSGFVVASFRPSIAVLVAMLKAHPNARVKLTGFTDNVGDAAANEAIGQRRADNLKAAIVAGGIAPSRIETGTSGMADPAATNDTDAGRHRNRRVELTVLSR